MKKAQIKNIFIIILCVFILLPIILTFLNVSIHEGYTDASGSQGQNTQMSNGQDVSYTDVSYTDVSYTNVSYTDVLKQTDFNIDRVNVESVTGNSGEYIYCPGGIITCPTGNLVEQTDASYFGTTYDFYCNDGSGNKLDENVICTNQLGKKNNRLELGSGCDKNSDDYTTTVLEGIESITDVCGNEYNGLNGFTSPYTTIPMTISGEYVLLYKDTGEYNKIKRCFLTDNPNCCDNDSSNGNTNTTNGNTNTNTNGNTNTTNGNTNTTTNGNDIKCLADNGASVGDPLCCGQDGVLQNTNYNCPSEYPKCIGYKCGETWGKCSART